MTQPSRTREYLYPEEPVQIEISSKQGVKPEVWWSEFRRNGERGPHAVEASVETAAGIKQKVLSRYKTKSMKIDQGRKVDICLRFSPDMPMIADKDFALGLLLVACDPRDPYLYSVTVSICERALPMDGGPAFTLNALKSASIGDSAQSLKANVSVVTSRDRRWWRSDFTCRPFLSSEISLEFIVIGEREVSNAQWKYMNRPQSSVLRLLENAEQTGDVIIVGKVRTIHVLAFVSRNICAPSGLILESSLFDPSTLYCYRGQVFEHCGQSSPSRGLSKGECICLFHVLACMITSCTCRGLGNLCSAINGISFQG